MEQPTRNKKRVIPKKPKTKRSVKKHPEYGTSKLENKFAKEFLDKLGVEYIYQFEAKDIGRFYDFAIKSQLGHMVLLEVDGDYW